MIATTEEALDGLFRTAILAISPRLTYQGATRWHAYDKARAGASQTRSFRLVWGTPQLRTGGAVFGGIFEHEVPLRVRTDYAGGHQLTQFLIADDYLQLRDVLSALKETGNGLQLVTPVESRRRLGATEDADVVQVDHTYSVRYMRTIAP